MLKCPTCERNVSIPVGGASVLPRNLHLEFEAEVAGYTSKLVRSSEVCCDHCIDGSSGPAVIFCCTCLQFLCKPCHEHHKRGRLMSKHKMVGLDQEGAKELQATIKPREAYSLQCSHESNRLKFYCEACKCFLDVCKDCFPVAHKDHAVIEVSTAAKNHQLEIKGALGNASNFVTKLIGAISGNDAMIEQVEGSKKNALLAINQAFEILQGTLDKRKLTLLSELEAISLSKTTSLTLQKEQFEKIVGDINHYTKVASHVLQTHTDHELVALGGCIPTELKATLNKVQTMSLKPNLHSDISVSVKTDGLVRELSQFGEVRALSLSPSSSTWTSTSVAKVGTRFCVKVESKTSQGQKYPYSDAQVKVEMRPKASNGAVVHGEVEDHRDGTYTIILTPQSAGPHQLLITMDGQHIQNSPHNVDVKDMIVINVSTTV